MRGETVVHPQPDVACRTDFDRDAVFGQIRHQFGILDSADAVADPFGAQGADGAPDAGGTSEFTRMRDAVQTGVFKSLASCIL